MNSPLDYCEPYLDKLDGTGQFFVEESAVIELLADEVLFCNSRKYVCLDGAIKAETLILFVNCNDLFWWACSDTETVTMSELESLYQAWKADGHRGKEMWCCRKRGLRPQACVEKEWRAAGVWTPELEALPKP